MTYLWAAGAGIASLPAELFQLRWHGRIKQTLDSELLFLGG